VFHSPSNGGIMARRKTYRKKSTALRAARRRNGSAYKVKKGWRVSK